VSERHRFLHAAVGADLVALGHLARLGGRQEHHDGGRAGAGAGPQRAQHLHAVHPRKAEVEQHQPGQGRAQPVAEGAPAQQVVERLLAVAGDADPALRVEIAEGPEGELDLERVVLDQEDVGLVRKHAARRGRRR
jgi:hypothetical protein